MGYFCYSKWDIEPLKDFCYDWEMEKTQIIKIAVNLFVMRDGQILLGRRKGKAGDGQWGLPGGHVDYGELLVDASKRELEEETGLKADELKFLHIVNDQSEGTTHYVHVDFLIENIKGEPMIKEPERCSEWKWFEFANLPEQIFFGHKPLIETFLKKLPFGDY